MLRKSKHLILEARKITIKYIPKKKEKLIKIKVDINESESKKKL